MKKNLMKSATAIVLCGMITSCSHEVDFGGSSTQKTVEETYETAFTTRFGTPAETLDWGFGTSSASTRAFTRSQVTPVVLDLAGAPYDEAWVTNYCETATEPNNTNAWDNYDNSTYATNWGEGGANSIDWNDPAQVADRKYFVGEDGNSDSWETRIAWALQNHPTWVSYTKDTNYVLNFKITGTWNGNINVVATEGLTNGVANGCERTVVVTGTWNLTDDQRVGSLGRIIVANGGKLNITSGKTLQMVNQARLVVLPGGEINGGNIEVSNGNESGRENYNGGTINVDKFNNNFGKFYNYSTFIATEYDGGAQESNFYNHSLVKIGGTGSSSNARIFNKCQWYCSGDMRARNYEGVNGSALIVDGQLMFSGSEDGTTDASYVGLAAGALVQCGTLYNNGTSWTGPTENGYAVLAMGKIVFLNWQQDAPEAGGYFENNIYAVADDWTNIPGGNGYQAGETATADYKFFHIVANCRGNGNVTKAEKGDEEYLPASENFVKGVSGCTPGFKINKEEDDDDEDEYEEIRVIAEDLTVNDAAGETDFDFNDVVFDVRRYTSGDKTGTVEIILQAAGGTLPLYVAGEEVHNKFGVGQNCMVNTNAESKGLNGATKDPVSFPTTEYSGSTIGEIAKSIEVKVTKNGQDYILSAPVGKVASKIGVGTDYVWCNERDDIENVYSLTDGTSLFAGYVQGKFNSGWYNLKKK